jgi:hypothetical protein
LNQPFDPPVLLQALSEPTPTPDTNATTTGNELTLFFDTYRPYRHIWVTHRSSRDVAFVNPVEVSVLSSGNEDGEPYVVPDGTTLYFSSSRPAAASAQGFNLFFAPIVDGQVMSPGELAVVNTEWADRAPVVSPDQTVIYFATSRESHGGTLDIWTATRPDVNHSFDHSRPLAELNSPTDDAPTYVADDGCELYFYASGWGARADTRPFTRSVTTSNRRAGCGNDRRSADPAPFKPESSWIDAAG